MRSVLISATHQIAEQSRPVIAIPAVSSDGSFMLNTLYSVIF